MTFRRQPNFNGVDHPSKVWRRSKWILFRYQNSESTQTVDGVKELFFYSQNFIKYIINHMYILIFIFFDLFIEKFQIRCKRKYWELKFTKIETKNCEVLGGRGAYFGVVVMCNWWWGSAAAGSGFFVADAFTPATLAPVWQAP